MCFFTTSTITVGKSNKSCVLAQAVLWSIVWFFATHVDRDGRLNLPNKDWSMVLVSHGVATRNTREFDSSSVHTENDISIGYIHISACTTRVVQTAAGGPITAVLSITE